MMKVLLLYPPIYFIDGVTDRPPLGILYLASVLEKNGISVKVLDLALDNNCNLENLLLDFRPNIIGISITTPLFKISCKIAKVVRKTLPESIIVAGGPHPSAMPQETLEDTEFNAVVAGEGENTFLEFINSLRSKTDISKIPGIYYKSKNGIYHASPRKYINNIDEIPFPARHVVPIHKYSMKINGVHATSMITSRGCPYNCVYCNKSTFGSRHRVRSAKNIISEIREITGKYDIRGILFVDDTFTVSSDRTNELCDKIIKEKLRIVWRCWTHPKSVDKKLLEKMYAAGCKVVCFGIESGDQEILDRSKKCGTVKSNLNAIRTAKEVGLTTKAFFMVGLPGESKHSIDNTIKFIHEARPDSADFYITTPFPQTYLWTHAERLGIRIVSRDWSSYYHAGKGGNAPAVIETKELGLDAIIRMQRRLRREFDKVRADR